MAPLLQLFPRYILPHQNLLARKEVPRLYNGKVSRVRSELSSIVGFCTTTDMWTSRTSTPFLALTTRWIDEDYVMN